MSTETNRTETDAAIEAGRMLQQPVFIDGRAYHRTNTGALAPVESAWKSPARIVREEDFQNPDHWRAYVQRFASVNAPPHIGMTKAPGMLTVSAILDYHAPGAPGCCDHRAKLSIHRNPRYTAIMEATARPMTQEQFIDFVRDCWRRGEILEPEAADMLDTLAALEAVSGESVKSIVSEGGKRSLTYNSNQEINSRLPLPKQIVLSLPVWMFGLEDIHATAAFHIDPKLREKAITFALCWPKAEETNRQLAYEIAARLEASAGFPVNI